MIVNAVIRQAMTRVLCQLQLIQNTSVVTQNDTRITMQ